MCISGNFDLRVALQEGSKSLGFSGLHDSPQSDNDNQSVDVQESWSGALFGLKRLSAADQYHNLYASPVRGQKLNDDDAGCASVATTAKT